MVMSDFNGEKGMTMKYCAQCGARLTEGARFCISCGSPVNAPSPHVPAPTEAAAIPAPATPAPAAAVPMPAVQAGTAPMPAEASVPPAGVTPAPVRKRSKGVVAAVVVAVVAVVAAAAFGLWWFLLRDDTSLAGRYSVSANGDAFELTVADDGTFTLIGTGGGTSRVTLTGTVGKGTAEGDDVRYPLSDIAVTNDEGTKTLSELIGESDDSGIGSALLDAISMEATAPKNASHGNIVGTWGLSASLLTYTMDVHITANADGTLQAVQSIPGQEPTTTSGTWTDNGGGVFTLTIDGAPVTVALPQ